METYTSCLPLLGGIRDDLSNPLVESVRCGAGHRPSHRKGEKESEKVDHNVQLGGKDKSLQNLRSERGSWEGGK